MELSVVRILGLLCLSHLCRAIGQSNNCSNFDVYDDKTKVTDFSCTLYETSSCTGGPSTFPEGLGTGTSVEKPLDFKATVFQRNITYPGNGHLYRASGIQYEWKGPVSGSSRHGIKGYYLKMMRLNSNSLKCRLLDLQSLNFNSTKLRFDFELYPFTEGERVTYVIELFSLPPPTDAEFDSGLYERHVLSVPPLHDFNTSKPINPKDWTTAISSRLDPAGGSVEVRFTFPEQGSLAQFDTYRVALVENGSSNYAFEANVTEDRREGYGSYVFKNIPGGVYKIQIIPNDADRYDWEKCQCYEIGEPPLPRRECVSACTLTETEYFTVSGFETTTTKLSTSTSLVRSPTSWSSSEPTTGMTTSGPTVSAGVVAAAVIASIVFADLVIVAVAFVYFRRRRNQKRFSDGDKINNNNADDKYESNGLQPYFIPNPINSSDKELKVPQLRRQSILLLASEDHKCFKKALERFAQFLQLHCQCDVVFASQQLPCLRKMANSYCWLSGKIDSADYVLIVTSVAASHLYNAFQKGYAYKEADLGPEGDLFTPGIQHICGKIANSEDVRKVIMVHFEHTSPSLRLPIAALPSRHYHLPNHLSSFLFHIHGLIENSMDLSKVNLPLQGNVGELEGGKEWLSAVWEARDFERLNPGWFEQKFGKPTEIIFKPAYDKQDSGFEEGHRLSGLSERRMSSVSTRVADTADQSAEEGLVTEGFTKYDFTAPSEVLSAYTVPFSVYTAAYRPLEIDQGSNISDQFREFNDRYELDRLQEQQQQEAETIPQEERSAISDQTNNPSADLFMRINIANASAETSHNDGDVDCFSVSSVQSV